MKLTPLARAFIAVVSLAVIGFVLWDRSRPSEAGPDLSRGGAPPPVAAPASGGAPPSAGDGAGAAPAGMVAIAGGSFQAGEDRHGAEVAPFFIDQDEVTIGAYRQSSPSGDGLPQWWSDAAFVEAHARAPMVSITQEEAASWCARRGKRLPTGLEWERAARGTDGRELPWGNDLARDRARLVAGNPQALGAAQYGYLAVDVDDPTYAGDLSPDGVRGLGGNVSEWTSDDGAPGEKLVRGGSWASYQVSDAAAWKAVPTRATQRATRIGFRCAISATDAAALTAATTATGGGLTRIKATGVLRVGAEPETPPMLVSTQAGWWAGFDYEVATAVAKRLGASVEIVPGRYAELPGMLAQGRIDAIISGYIPDEGLSQIAWSKPYLEFGLCLVARKGSDVRRVSDLAGKKVGVFNDPVAEAKVRALLPTATLSTWEDGYFQALRDGAMDAFIYDFPYAQAELKPFADSLAIVEYNLSDAAYAVGLPAGDPALKAEVDAAIDALRASPDYKKLVRTWLGGARAVEDFAAGEKVYTVKPGDSLSAIAARELGDMGAWPRIWEANRRRIGNPDLIDVGMKIALPKR